MAHLKSFSKPVKKALYLILPTICLIFAACIHSATEHALSGDGVMIFESLKYTGDFDEPPKGLVGGVAQYPQASCKGSETGDALLAFTVTKEGRVSGVEALRCERPAFAASAILAMSDSKFAPARKQGVAVECRGTVLYSFAFRYQQLLRGEKR